MYYETERLANDLAQSSAQILELEEDRPLIEETQTKTDYSFYDLPLVIDESNITAFEDSLRNASSENVLTETELRSCTINEPRKLGTLNSGSKKFVYVLDRDNQGNGKLFGLGELSLGKRERIAIVDYVEYKDTLCTPGNGKIELTNIRLAAGVRLVLRINNVNRKVSVNIPSKIAAAAEFGLAEATFTIETVGFVSKETRAIIGNLGGDFNVESYVKVIGAIGEITKIMKDDMTVNPVQLPVKRN
jgi:hypothetical protein